MQSCYHFKFKCYNYKYVVLSGTKLKTVFSIFHFQEQQKYIIICTQGIVYLICLMMTYFYMTSYYLLYLDLTTRFIAFNTFLIQISKYNYLNHLQWHHTHICILSLQHTLHRFCLENYWEKKYPQISCIKFKEKNCFVQVFKRFSVLQKNS